MKTNSKKKSNDSTDKILAIVGLIVNMFFWAGLGTLIGGDIKTGIIQMILFAIAIPLSFILIGIPLLIGVWIWALVSSIKQIQSAN